jgi:exportin-T
VRDSEEGWQVCLSIVTGDQKRSDATRFFSLQVIDNSLPRLNNEQLQFIRNNLFSHLQKLVNSSDYLEAVHFRNKFAQSVGYLFIVSYQEAWTTFFDDLMALMAGSNSNVENSPAVDMYLRILRCIHEEIGDNLISRPVEVTKRNNMLKDLVRERAMVKLSSSWMDILQYYTNNSTSPESLGNEIVDGALRVIGAWVSWIDITLVVNPTYLNLIFSQLANPKQRLSACDSLSEIISKKMKPADKIELIALLNPSNLIAQLPTGSNSDIDFDERVAKLSNIVTLELVHILDGTTQTSSGVNCTPQEIEKAEQLLMDIMPIVLQFLSNEYDDTSSQVFQCLGEYLAFVRKESKKEKTKVDTSNLTKNSSGQYIDFPADSNFVPQQRLQLLSHMLNKIIMKMKYDPSTDWTGGEDESESEFLDVRNRLKILQDQIAAIDQDLYTDGMAAVINSSLDGSTSQSWQDVELGLFEFSAFSDSTKNGSITLLRGTETKASRTLYELFVKMIHSGVITINHPSIQLLYIELVNRHSAFFTAERTDLLNKTLEVFVSPLAIHNSNKKVQVRSWYLFFKFIKAVKNFVGDIAEQIFNSISSLLEIKAEPPKNNNNGNDSDSDNDDDSGTFESQLYLFELCGVLFGSVSNEDHGHALSQRLLQPIFSDIERCLQRDTILQDPQLIAQVHHNLMALGTFARGFDELGGGVSGPAAKSNKKPVQELKNATQVIIVVLERMASLEMIRSSARFAFSRLIPLLGVDILGEISRLISALLEGSTIREFGDFLSFLGQLSHSFKTEYGVFEMFTSLLSPLVNRMLVIFEECNKEASTGSTDAILLKRSLRKAFLQLIFNLLNNGMGAIFVTENNAQAFQNTMECIFLFASDMDDPQVQKLAIVVLSKMLATWADGEVKPDPIAPDANVFGKGMVVNGFNDQFIFEQYTRVCWELPSKPGFDIRDAQTRLVVSEAAALQRAIYERKGPVYVTYLSNQYFPSIGLPENMAQDYLGNLSQLTSKDFKKYFIDFLSRVFS